MAADPVRVTLRGLTVRAGGTVIVDGVDLDVASGQLTALAGMSGCGKTTTARALLGLVAAQPGVVGGSLEIAVGDRVLTPYRDLAPTSPRRAVDRAFAPVRGALLGYVPQHAAAALQPMWRVGTVIRRAARHLQGDVDPLPALARAGLPDPERVASLYPHQLSGGMAQRVAIAAALACGSRVLVLDEPTSGLDPVVQAGVLDEIRRLVRQEGVGALLITHDLRVLPGLADQVVLLDAGRVAERTTAAALRDGALTSEAGRRLHAATARVAGGVLG